MRLIISLQFLFALLISFSSSAADTEGDKHLAHLDSCVSKAEYYLNKNLDSTLYFIGLIEEALKENTVEGSISNFVTLGWIYSATGNKEKGLEYSLRAKQLNDSKLRANPSDPELILQSANIFVGLGNLYFSLNKLDEGLVNYEAALAEIIKTEGKVPENDLVKQKVGVYNNIAGIYIQHKDFDSAIAYYQNALKLNNTIKNKVYESSITNNLGICYLEKGQYDLADHYLLKSLSVRRELGDRRGEAQSLNNLAKIQYLKGNLNRSTEIFEEAYSVAQEIGNIHSSIISLESLSTLYDTLGNYKQAYRAFKDFKTLSDSIFNQETTANIAVLEREYLKTKEQEIDQLERENELSEKQRLKTQNLATFGALFFLLLTAILIIFLLKGKIKRSKLQHEKLKLESENHQLETQTLEEALEFKERELTANALFLLKNNELIADIINKLLEAKSTFKQENQKIIQEIILELRENQNQNIWEEFEAHFVRVHSDFYQRLQEKFSNLTSNELKLCAFLRLNMTTKEISSITHQSVNSIIVARSRLRKKLEIDGEDTQLINFLMQV